MTSPAKILVSEVKREGVIRSLEDGGGIWFQKPLGLDRPEDKAEAILVILEPEQSPREVAKILLWALR